MSTSTDRGVIVWGEAQEANGALKPQLAVIKESKSNIDGAWNHLGNKFCVGASSGNVFIGKFDDLQNFWVARTISGKKPLHSSSVVSVRFEPLSGRVLASGSVDGKCYITSCYDEATDLSATSGPFGYVTSFGETLFSFTVIGWVNFVSFAPDSTQLCFATHDCEVNFVDISKGPGSKDKPDKVLYKGNPFLCGQFINSSTYVACGYDKVPFLFKKNAKASWDFTRYLDDGINQVKAAQIGKGSFEQSKIFFQQTERAASGVKLDDDMVLREMNTKHSNYINCLKGDFSGNKLCTSDINGNLFFWETSSL
jgi:WD40 repeat protein